MLQRELHALVEQWTVVALRERDMASACTLFAHLAFVYKHIDEAELDYQVWTVYCIYRIHSKDIRQPKKGMCMCMYNITGALGYGYGCVQIRIRRVTLGMDTRGEGYNSIRVYDCPHLEVPARVWIHFFLFEDLSGRRTSGYRRRPGLSPSMPLLVFWPLAGACGAGEVRPRCTQLLWCELCVMKDLPPPQCIA